MAGLFYSLKEAAEKLNKTEGQLKEMVKEGKLREFRDGPNILFKVDEVESLAVDEGVPTKIEDAKQPSRPELPVEPIETPEPKKTPEAQAPEDEILLAPEIESPAGSGLTEADTALSSEGISILGETNQDYQLTDDTMAETVSAAGKGPGMTDATTPGASLEEIEEDVNLDSFGSGSGLLDLSLQADDTSLGGILDEIYTAEGGEAQPPAEAGSAVEMVDEAEQILPNEGLAGPQPTPAFPPIPQSYIEPIPDTQSNTLGLLLLLPLLALLYTLIVAIAGLRGVVPSILAAIQGAIWYIVIGAIVVAGLVVGAAFGIGGGSGKAIKRAPKPKKTKKAKKADLAAPEEKLTA